MAVVTMRATARLGVGGVLLGAAIIAVLHVVGPGAAISPIRRTISEYGLTSAAWAFNAAVLAVAIGSALILVAVARTGRAGRIGLVLGAVWVAGLLTLVAFPKANWALGPSVSGYVHRAASLVSFIVLPVAVTVLLRRHLAGGAPGRVLARWGVALAGFALVWFLPIVVAIVTAAQGGRWWMAVPLGLVERGMAVTEVAALLVLAAWAVRTCRAPGSWRAPGPRVPGAAVEMSRTIEPVPVTDPAAP